MPEATSKKTQNPVVMNGADDQSALSAQAKTLGLPVLLEVPKTIDKSLLSVISEDMAKRYQMVPFRKEKDILFIAMVDPQNFEALNALRFLAEKEHISMEIHL
ncbi:MAG TPA: hypothetical protein VJH89_00415, partial [Patescibacteria group bacterium]|nr:hypothetical protein [Patescibacteria group bacterium]